MAFFYLNSSTGCHNMKEFFSISISPDKVSSLYRLYMEIFSNFPSSVDELTFIAKPQSLCVRNFVDADSGMYCLLCLSFANFCFAFITWKNRTREKIRSDELSLLFSIGIENCLASLIVFSLIARCYDLLQWTR